MSAFYDNMAKVASDQITDKGRLVTLRRNNKTYNPTTGKAEGPPPDDFPVYGVFTDIKQDLIDGTVIKAGDKELLVAALGLNVKPTNAFVVIDDDQTTWQVQSVKETKPGDTALLYKLVTRQ